MTGEAVKQLEHAREQVCNAPVPLPLAEPALIEQAIPVGNSEFRRAFDQLIRQCPVIQAPNGVGYQRRFDLTPPVH